ncbi:zinc finger CCCH domain-containing protein 6-like [Epinephelus moara]|uniref:zinc finger CCCH domain-containing protein 6-like n=1 Tax=Epinephelus moara TaxID=300413 RepID=UPI00214E70D1|nr:zinc finger CCCH domain-containing protein 6-like [Epinephelus moara]
MAFANLFTGLSAIEESVTSPGPPAFTHRNETESGKRGDTRKRRNQTEPTGPHNKKQHFQAQTTRSFNAASFKDDDSRTRHHHMRNTYSEHARDAITKEVIHNHGGKAGHKGQQYKNKNNLNVNKQQQKKKQEGQKNPHQHKDRWRNTNRGGGHQTRPAWRKGGGDGRNRNDKQDVQVKHTRTMTQEFKDQNAVLVNGRLVCRHFLYGRCIKDAECQLEHIQCYNDLIKEGCKFYIQGFCTKGESCPYMHKSFPCKFFHRKGNCFQGADCKFSHDPLNDVTTQLLNETLKRDNDLYELAKKAEQESSGPPQATDPETIETNNTPDTLLQPLRPNFYNSAETKAEKETLVCETEEPADILEEAVPPHASDAAEPHIPLSSKHDDEEPVCYSVAAVLGPQLSKPFPSFFGTREAQESGPLSSSEVTSGSAAQSEVPYSVDAVLRSYKSVENSTFGHRPTPPTALTVSYTPKTDFKEITDLHSVNTRHEVNKSQEKTFKSLPSLQVHTGPRPTQAFKDYKKPGGNTAESLKPAQRSADEVKSESTSSESKGDMKGSMNLPVDITVNCKGEGVPPLGRTNQTSTSKHPAQLRPHLSVLTLGPQASIKPFNPFSSLPEFKGGAAVPVETVTSSFETCDSANSASHHFAAKNPTKVHLDSKKTQSSLKRGAQHHSAEIAAQSSSKMTHCGDFAVQHKTPLKTPFRSLFASPITDTLQPKHDAISSSSLLKSSFPAPRSADVKSNRVKNAVEPDKASTSSFLSLFAAPLSAPPLSSKQTQPDDSRTSSCSQKSNQSVDNTSHLSNSKRRASNLKTPLPHQGRTDVKGISHSPRSHDVYSNPETENEDSSAKHMNKPTKQLVNPVSSCASDSLSETSTSPTPCDDGPHAAHANQQQPDVSSHKGSEKAAAANSVLKSLFLSLSPYQQD